MVRFSAEAPIRYQDTDRHLRCTPTALLGAMQETAILQSESVGRGIDWLAARNEVWMIVQTLVQIERTPRWRARLAVTTWPSDIGRLLSRREFLLADERGECARATTLWAYVDTTARKVARVSAELASAYPIDAARAIDGPFSRPARCQAADLVQERPIRRGDIDSNGHVNNLRYLAWMLDCLPADLPTSAELCELNLRYQKETLPDQWIVARTQELRDPSEDGRHFVHEVVLRETGERIATAQTGWRLGRG